MDFVVVVGSVVIVAVAVVAVAVVVMVMSSVEDSLEARAPFGHELDQWRGAEQKTLGRSHPATRSER